MLYCPYKRKTTAVAGSWRSLQPAQVITAPTQRTNPHRMGYYTLKRPFTQGGALSFFPSVVLHQEDSIFLRCVGLCPAQRFCFSLDPGGAQAPPGNG